MDMEKQINDFVENKDNGKTNETRMDNKRTMGNSAFSKLVGGQPEANGICCTAEALNRAGCTSPILEIEELEELEARGINPYWNKNEFRKELRRQAQENGVWLDKSYLYDKALVHDQQKEGTSENDVYLNFDGKTLTKINNLSYVQSAGQDRNFNSFIDRLIAHNRLFPDVLYTIKGFMDNKNGIPSLIIEQPFVFGIERNATKEEIGKYLTDNGFKLAGTRGWSNGHIVWSNGRYELYDARSANVLKGKDGNLYFVDAFPHSVEYMQSENGM